MYKSSEELLAALEKDEQEYQFLLLDVVMDGLNGIELAARLRKKGNQVPIIFVSSYEDYALMGYEVEAVRYLAKPVREDKLREAIHYCKERFYRKKHILISTAEGIRRILFKAIGLCRNQRKRNTTVCE